MRLIAAALMLISASTASAEEGPCLPDKWGPAGARMFAKLDPKAVGWVDADQFVAHRTRRFRDFDANGDGWVTFAEYHAKHVDWTNAALLAHFGRFDRDEDHRVSQAEWDAAELARFNRIDTDGDGRVTRKEFLCDRARVCAARTSPTPP
jgi:hypothetical protein